VRAPISRHRAWQVGVDALLVAVAWWLAWSLRFDGTDIPRPRYYDRYLDWSIVALVVAIKIPVFLLSGFYDRWWRYVSTRDMWSVLRGVTLATIVTFVVFVLFEVHRVRVPSGVWFIDLLLCLALVAGARLLARTLIERPRPGNVVARGKEVVVVGAGDAAQLVVKEMLRNPVSYEHPRP
jgi:FlaA1/EpsC-like NDP-sugar epimerase